ncbi:hypothetical protein [Sphingomonas montanisoli]|uniref:YozE SAM-like domain-containing protein n=1 Tax=Sphingomonas montanisoli TaxID=2606412 RepID=A0A5D9C006_9SPHN|nr:hypothetical protein [Sphingomonas montanisoli]TZG24592.1 hypothetical protein FYJ91_18375 [Sphingomonas montanisoli]
MDGNHERQPFASWLLQQQNKGGFIGSLAKGMKDARGFPRQGSVDDVRKFLSTIRAEGDAFEALDDAENDWLCH